MLQLLVALVRDAVSVAGEAFGCCMQRKQLHVVFSPGLSVPFCKGTYTSLLLLLLLLLLVAPGVAVVTAGATSLLLRPILLLFSL